MERRPDETWISSCLQMREKILLCEVMDEFSLGRFS